MYGPDGANPDASFHRVQRNPTLSSGPFRIVQLLQPRSLTNAPSKSSSSHDLTTLPYFQNLTAFNGLNS